LRFFKVTSERTFERTKSRELFTITIKYLKINFNGFLIRVFHSIICQRQKCASSAISKIINHMAYVSAKIYPIKNSRRWHSSSCEIFLAKIYSQINLYKKLEFYYSFSGERDILRRLHIFLKSGSSLVVARKVVSIFSLIFSFIGRITKVRRKVLKNYFLHILAVICKLTRKKAVSQ
jgi:hypothetical protein